MSGDGDRSEKLGISLTPEEKKQIRVEAAKRDMSMAELIRQILRQEVLDQGNVTIAEPTSD